MLMPLVRLIKATNGIEERAEAELRDLLCGSGHNQEKWLAAAKKLLWESDIIPGIPEVSIYLHFMGLVTLIV